MIKTTLLAALSLTSITYSMESNEEYNASIAREERARHGASAGVVGRASSASLKALPTEVSRNVAGFLKTGDRLRLSETHKDYSLREAFPDATAREISILRALGARAEDVRTAPEAPVIPAYDVIRQLIREPHASLYKQAIL